MQTAEKEHKKTNSKVTLKQASKKSETPTPIWFDKNQESEEISAEAKKELDDMLKEFR